MVISDISKVCCERCLDYIDAQLLLIDEFVQRAIKRQKSEDKPTTQQLRAWANAYRALRQSLVSNPHEKAAGKGRLADLARAEAWLAGT
jgi:hypothetical protein